MKIYYLENTGAKKPRIDDSIEDNCDYFFVADHSYNPITGKVSQIIKFYERQEDAELFKSPNVEMTVVYTPTTEQTITDLIATALTWENIETISEEIITLKGAAVVADI